MDPAVITAITGGVSLLTVGALIKVVRIFLKHIDAADRRQDEAQVRQEKFLGNHLSSNTRSLERVADRLERLEEVQRASQVVVKNADEVKVNK